MRYLIFRIFEDSAFRIFPDFTFCWKFSHDLTSIICSFFCKNLNLANMCSRKFLSPTINFCKNSKNMKICVTPPPFFSQKFEFSKYVLSYVYLQPSIFAKMKNFVNISTLLQNFKGVYLCKIRRMGWYVQIPLLWNSLTQPREMCH